MFRKILCAACAAVLLFAAVPASAGASYDEMENGRLFLFFENGIVTGTDSVWTGRLVIPDTAGNPLAPVTGIAAGALRGQSTLTNLVLPGSITYIGEGAFHGAAALSYVEFRGTHEQAARLFPTGQLDNGTEQGVPVTVTGGFSGTANGTPTAPPAAGAPETVQPGPASASQNSDELTQRKETAHFVFLCTQQDEKILDDVASALENAFDRITGALGRVPPQKTAVYIAPNLQAYHTLVGRPNDPDWSVGQAGPAYGSLSMVSPQNPGPAHTYSSIVTVAVHEFVHVVAQLFPRQLPAYASEGLATYLAGQSSGVREAIQMDAQRGMLPSIQMLQSSGNALQSDINLYTYGYAYIDFLVKTRGFDSIIALLEGQPETAVLGANSSALNDEWIAFLEHEYAGLSSVGSQGSPVLTKPSVVEDASSPPIDSASDDPPMPDSTPATADDPASGEPAADLEPEETSGVSPEPGEEVSAPDAGSTEPAAAPDGSAGDTPSAQPMDSAAEPSADPSADAPPVKPAAPAALTFIADAGLSIERPKDGVPHIAGLSLADSDSCHTVRDLVQMFDVPGGCTLRILLPDGIEASLDSMAATGLDVELSEEGNIVEHLPIVVAGDVTGCGAMNLTQLVRMAAAFRGTSPLKGAYLAAGDFSGTGTITLTDVIREAQLLRAAT